MCCLVDSPAANPASMRGSIRNTLRQSYESIKSSSDHMFMSTTRLNFNPISTMTCNTARTQGEDETPVGQKLNVQSIIKEENKSGAKGHRVRFYESIDLIYLQDESDDELESTMTKEEIER